MKLPFLLLFSLANTQKKEKREFSDKYLPPLDVRRDPFQRTHRASKSDFFFLVYYDFFLHFRIILREAEVHLLICLIFLACEVRTVETPLDKLPLLPKLWRIIFALEIQEVSCLMCCTARHLACERVKNSNHPNNCRPIYSSFFSRRECPISSRLMTGHLFLFHSSSPAATN